MTEKQISWWVGARLYLRSGKRGVRATELFRGPFFDALNAALARPEPEQPRLFIRLEDDEQVVPWSRIAQLAAQPDFPTMI